MGLYDSPTLVYRDVGEPRRHEIRTADEEQVLAEVHQVVGPPPKSGLNRFLSPYPDRSRIVVRADAPGGTPLFFVDRAAGRADSALQPPCTVVAPDGRPVGGIVHDAAAFAQSFLEGRSALPGGRSSFRQAHHVVDAHQRPLCAVAWEPVEMGGHLDRPRGGGHAIYTDPAGAELARLEGDVLHLRFRLPEPLGTLLVASPLAFLLMNEV
ncbi:hypothetical protein [Marinactinospora rubrisoli]|uniref:Uncharacterized protein n=1 Tax=Marinactinospora rubrisoli TaxID=2715399 RepID=A0ABW2KGG4_9ACTN